MEVELAEMVPSKQTLKMQSLDLFMALGRLSPFTISLHKFMSRVWYLWPVSTHLILYNVFKHFIFPLPAYLTPCPRLQQT